MLIHIERDGEQFGPYTLADLNAYLAQGALLPTDLAWWDGAPGWMQMNEVPGVVLPGAVTANTPTSLAKGSGGKKLIVVISAAVGALAAVVAAVVLFNGDDNKENNGALSVGSSSRESKQDGGAPASANGYLVFAKTVEPIFRKNRCFECHNSKESKKAKADLDFSIPSTLRAFVSPNQKGNPATTPLILAITPGAAEPMPPNGTPVSATDVEKIKQWIAAGAKF